MKKTLIIIGSIVLVIILLGVAWWYLLMNGAPESLSSIPNPFGPTSAGEFATTTVPIESQVPTAPAGSLRKISAEPVAGAVIFSRDGADFVRYALRGTGHIFEVDLQANGGVGATARISGTTIPRATRAIFSPQGSRVVLVTETTGGQQRLFAGAIERTDTGEGTLTTFELESAARNIAFDSFSVSSTASSTGESIFYTVPTAEGSSGYEHNLKTNVRTVRFTSPLRDIVVLWGSGANAPLPIVAYTTPTAHFRGYAYEGTGFRRLFGGVNGLMVVRAANYRVVSYAENNSLVSHADTPNGTALSIPVFPEKCAADETQNTILWCAAPLALPPGAYPDWWYQGAISFDDSIWKLDVATGSATLISVPSEDAGEAIDATDMQATPSGDTLLFINKKDGALWVQETR